jgi:hypothetical protein
MNELITASLKEAGGLLKDVVLVIFTYIFATKQAVKNKKNEIRLEQESEERERIEEYHRQIPVLMSEMKSNGDLLRSMSTVLDNLSKDNNITRQRLDHLADADDQMRISNEKKFDHLEAVVGNIAEEGNKKISRINDQINGIVENMGRIQQQIPKSEDPKPDCPAGHFIPP